MKKIAGLILLCVVLPTTVFASELLTSENFEVPPLPENQELLMLTLELAPGETSSPHRHNAHTYVYVLEGTVIMQVDGEEAVSLGPGEIFYENPDSIHTRSDNASTSESAKILVYMLKTIGQPTSMQVSL